MCIGVCLLFVFCRGQSKTLGVFPQVPISHLFLFCVLRQYLSLSRNSLSRLDGPACKPRDSPLSLSPSPTLGLPAHAIRPSTDMYSGYGTQVFSFAQKQELRLLCPSRCSSNKSTIVSCFCCCFCCSLLDHPTWKETAARHFLAKGGARGNNSSGYGASPRA